MPIIVPYGEFQWWKVRESCHKCAGVLSALAVEFEKLGTAIEELAPVMRKVWIAARRMQLAIWLVRLIRDEAIAKWAADRVPGWVLLRLPLQGFEEPWIPGVG